jgi:hypothetical protein
VVCWQRRVADQVSAYVGGQFAPVRGERQQDAVTAVLAGVGVRPVQQPVVGDDRVSGAQGERDLFRLVGHGGIALVEAG